MNHKKIIVALDSNNINQTLKLAKKLKKEVYGFKIGYEYFYNFGIVGYKKIRSITPNIFLDLKLHDIPNTVNKGIKAINKLSPKFTTLHISGGNEMMKAAKIKNKKMKILGVSVLTSLTNSQIRKYYNEKKVELIVNKFVKEALKCNLDGVVCSPKEIKTVKKIAGKKLLIVTPGIRPQIKSNITDDQKRTMSPKEAIVLGADFLVIGRPITKSKNPLKAVKIINDSIRL
tara:strand:+ start:93 stop:782 length:690 start_codon:yes stop_codon:yes gene_type:complete